MKETKLGTSPLRSAVRLKQNYRVYYTLLAQYQVLIEETNTFLSFYQKFFLFPLVFWSLYVVVFLNLSSTEET